MSLAFGRFTTIMKELDFSGGFLSVIRNLVGMFPKHPKKTFFLKQQNAQLAQKSYQFMLY
ncbi:hypothetical protein V5H78_03395 [Helicobacter pylori]